ncbi:MAG: ABC transporter ATP-binding protein [Chloroflexota bacterium]|nr:ABC transporter ATP-binding protein [Chloroflexota bacterium]
MTEITNVVEMRGIVKRFPGVLANDQVNFELRRGEVQALLGENGAGKSTLMNILAGLYHADSGEIRVRGQAVTFHSPADAIACGIGMVYQHFMLVPSQTVTENIILGLREPRFFLNLPAAEKHVAELSEKFGMKVDPRAKIWQLSVGEQQRVEILKMLYRGVQVLIMDEPTAVLTPIEVREFFETVRSMAQSGQSLVFISHKLDEVLAIADRITVMRDGRVTAAGVDPKSVTKSELAHRMVGRDIAFKLDKAVCQPGAAVLDIKDLRANNDKGLPALRGVSLQVCAGEIVGIAGVAGNGQSELAHVITGLRTSTGGSVRVNGTELKASALTAIETGVSHVPEDRAGMGSAPNLSVFENLIMKSYRRPPLAQGLRIDTHKARDYATDLKQRFEIAAPTIDTESRLLSGGNLQRLILAREISEKPQLLVAVHPTRGLDVGATEAVHRLLLEQRAAGAALLLISEDLDEVLALSDRVAVMYEGKIAGEMPAEGADVGHIGLLMTGTK